jgi:hypothetical protein
LTIQTSVIVQVEYGRRALIGPDVKFNGVHVQVHVDEDVEVAI